MMNGSDQPAGGPALSTDELDRRWELVVAHRQHALKVARARTRTLADAEDLASEALARAVSLDQLRPETVQGLLSTIVMRLATDLHRREATRLRHEASRSGDGRGASVEEQVTDVAEARWLARQVATLAVREREVLLHRASGHTNASTASSLGMTYKSVESAYTRARGHLQLAWKTTLGLVLGTLVGLRRLAERSQPAISTTTVALGTVAFVLLLHQTPAPGKALTVGPSDVFTSTAQAHPPKAVALPGGLPARAARPAKVLHPVSVAAAPAEPTVVHAKLGSAKGPVEGEGGVSGHLSRSPEELLGGVVYCLQPGSIHVHGEGGYNGCRPPSP